MLRTVKYPFVWGAVWTAGDEAVFSFGPNFLHQPFLNSEFLMAEVFTMNV